MPGNAHRRGLFLVVVVTFGLGSALVAALVVLVARLFRGRFFATFTAVVLTVHVVSSTGMYARFPELQPLFVYLQGAVLVHFLSLVRARLRPLPWRALVQIPALWFSAGAFLALPWALPALFGYEVAWPWLPYALAALGTIESMRLAKEAVHIDVSSDRPAVEGLARHPRAALRTQRPLRIVQITDPHLGPFMSAARLRRICQRAVDAQPDLIVLTGDLLTMEAHDEVEAATAAFAPLALLPGRVFACLGNHDLEALPTVQTALSRAGVQLLVDEEAILQTEVGPVQILGMDFTWRDRAAHLSQVCLRYPRRPEHLRVVLLHDPGAFVHLPDDEGDLVLSGHTHGGQLGLVSLGLPWTFLSLFSSLPDHGLWARGRDRLYVHRGTGHYGFPIRLGVPAEESTLFVHVSSA